MIQDLFKNSGSSVTSPATGCFSILPDDRQDLLRATKAIYVRTGGDIVLRLIDGDADVLFANTIGGSIIDVRVRAVRQTGTAEAEIVGLV